MRTPQQGSAGGSTRRSFIRTSSFALAAAGIGAGAVWPAGAAASIRQPDSLPDPLRPPGTPTPLLPFDHIVVVMMENHSFDNLLGALARSGQPAADGLSFTSAGIALNSNPGADGTVASFPFASTAQGANVSQTWNATHEQIDGGAMDGFVNSVGSTQPMGYWTPQVLPFAYSLAQTFTVANRWFCSAPGPTFPNRRFLMAIPPTAGSPLTSRASATRRHRTGPSSTACMPTASVGATTSSISRRRRSSRR